MIDLREVKASSVIGFLFGGSCILGLAVFAWWLSWDATATDHLKLVKHNLDRQERIWAKANSGIRIEYEDIITHGFPFEMEIRLLRPRVVTRLSTGTFQISTNYISFYPIDDDAHRYRLQSQPDGVATLKYTSGQLDNYFIHISNLPDIFVHGETSEGARDARISEYGVQMKGDIVLNIQKERVARRIPFKVQVTEEPMWRYLPGDISPAIVWFYQLCKQAVG